MMCMKEEMKNKINQIFAEHERLLLNKIKQYEDEMGIPNSTYDPKTLQYLFGDKESSDK